MADTVQTNGRSSLLNPVNNRVSTRSTRKKKTIYLSPKKFCDLVIAKSSNKSFEAGVAEFFKEYYLESPTFANYFKTANKEKNFSETVWLYDATRVIVPDVDYYHASWVDGIKPQHYILAQAPLSVAAQKNFFKLLAHVKADGLIVADGSEEVAGFISNKFDGTTKKSSEKAGEDISTAVISENGVSKLKAVRLNKWADGTITGVELVDMMEKARKFLGCPLKGTLVITCKDGAAKSGLVAFLDTEADRLAKSGKVKHTDTVKMIRFQRSNTFDSADQFELGMVAITELCTRAKKK
uniref:Tyrosine-protein phosphatase domain-containing protein n=1 Tax=Caenorhabditis japonica TaxID=281687 RepID=A0A8R1DH76_CAEJA